MKTKPTQWQRLKKVTKIGKDSEKASRRRGRRIGFKNKNNREGFVGDSKQVHLKQWVPKKQEFETDTDNKKYKKMKRKNRKNRKKNKKI